jgi:hypothetical protein
MLGLHAGNLSAASRELHQAEATSRHDMRRGDGSVGIINRRLMAVIDVKFMLNHLVSMHAITNLEDLGSMRW